MTTLESPVQSEVEITPDGYKIIRFSDSGSGGSSRGGKGGRGGAGASVREDSNTIRSKAYIRLLFALCEGPIFGYPAGVDLLQNIYLDETPLRNSDGSFNFKDFLVEIRPGTQDQTHISGVASAAEREVSVGIQLKKVNGPTIRTVTDPNIDAVQLRFMFPAMRTVSDDGSRIAGASVTLSVKLQSAGGQFVEVARPIINEKATSPFEIANLRVPLTGPSPWNISVERITADSNSEKLANDSFWQGYTEIIDAKLRYPNTCVLFLQVDAEQFSSIPRLAVRAHWQQVLIPHNYDPFNRTYSGFFNGSLVLNWSNNPAWILYDLITNKRYGLGERIPRQLIDVSTFYSAAQYCDELVPDGFGGVEPRFALNAYITTQEDALDLLEMICSTFRSMPYSLGGAIALSQDRPRPVTKIFSPANVICEDDEGNPVPPFDYSSSALDTRFTAAYVRWNNPANFYKEEEEYYEDPEAIAKYGFNPTNAVGFGITRRGQASRYARWLVETAQNITQTVTFKVGSEGDLIGLGEVFEVADPLIMQKRCYGRISPSTASAITLDEPVSLDRTKTHRLKLWNPDTNETEERTIVMPQTHSTTLQVFPPFSFSPQADAVYQLESTDLKSTPFQCVSVVENGHQFEITGLEYFGTLYDAVDLDLQFDKPVYGGLPNLAEPVQSPTAFTAIESLYQAIGSGGVKSRLVVGWSPSSSPWVTKYLLEYRRSGDVQYKNITIEAATSYSLDDLEQGSYDFRLYAINGLGARSSPLVDSKSVLGLTAPPGDVSGLQISYYEGYAILSWDPSPDLDVRVGGYFQVKYTPKSDNINWFDGGDLAIANGMHTQVQIPILNGAFLVKAIDSSGTDSLNPAILITANAPQFTNYLTHLDVTESPSFSGSREGTTVTGGLLKLGTSELFDSAEGLFDDRPGLFDETNDSKVVLPSGFYYFENPVDLGDVYTVRIVARMDASAASENQFFDDTPGLFDDRPGLFDGQSLTEAKATLQISVSQDGITFGAWQDFIVGDYLGRVFKFRVVLESKDSLQNVFISSLGVTLQLPERVESGNATTAAGSATTVNYKNQFRYNPQVSVSILNAQAGDRVANVAVTINNFSTEIRDSSGSIVSRSIAYFAQGFGRKPT